MTSHSKLLLEDVPAPERSPREVLIRQLEFLLYKAQHGMGMPYSREDVAHYQRLLDEARAAPETDPGLQLAAKLAERTP